MVYALDDVTLCAGGRRQVRLACGHEYTRCLGFEPIEQIEIFTVEEAPPHAGT